MTEMGGQLVMQKGIYLGWKRPLRKISLTVLFCFLFNIIALDLINLPLLNLLMPTPMAQAITANRDDLGIEAFRNYYGKDIGNGSKCYVNIFNGNLVVEKNLVDISGRGTGLHESIIYNSLDTIVGMFGAGWQLGSDVYIRENADNSVTFTDGDFTNHIFTKNPDGTYNAPAGVDLKLTKISSNIFEVKSPDNTVLRLENGFPKTITDEKGNATTLTYGTYGITQARDASGRNLTYNYTGARITSIPDPGNRVINLGYDGFNRLSSISDVKGTITFAYDATTGKLSNITDGNNHKTSFFYDASDRVSKINDARSTQSTEYSTTFSYDTTLLKTTVTDPASKTITYTHNSNGNLTQLQDGAGNVVNYTWNNNRLTNVSDATCIPDNL